MPLFQQSVLKKYLNDLDQTTLQKSWQLFINLFHNSSKQENIRTAKEEQYQEGFLRELFVQVLGYTLNPEPNFNLTTEYKNEKDSKKADGAILKDGAVMGVIELKGTDTTDLAKIETQAFGYKNNQKGCTYIITSNFEKIRFYINDAIDFEEFNLFLLTKDEFALLYLCLHKDHLLKDIPLKLKQASITEEENVTKKLYSDYSAFKKLLFQNITAQNPQYDKLLLFQKTQKLLDRFLFILFAEDRLLLPPNSVREILKQWHQLKDMDAEVPLYDRFKLYFGYMNTGRTGKQHDIFAYNGGLFAADEVLDTIVINDNILYESTFGLSNYNFETEVDVNILGHIFEHSLSEIEEVQSELEGTAIDKTKTRRKKDGVFYTPRYITKYIVENTVGTLCTQKKEELKIVEDEFTPEKRKANKKLLLEKLDTYRKWLLNITICDPACGSGAFLNQALEFLIIEHRNIDELRAKLFGDALVLTDLENEILENNLYGVDINDEAVEIARLSLWLRTAKKGRKLSSLSSNIKCGNSLIDDPAVAGDKAFNWREQFPAIFAKGGFDVVIGNPPYGRYSELSSDFKNNLKKNDLYGNTSDLAEFFIRKVLKSLVKKDSMFSFIVPKGLTYVKAWSEIRQFFLNDVCLLKLFDTSKSFDEVLYEMIIFVIQNNSVVNENIECGFYSESINSEYLFPKKLFSETIFYLGFPKKYVSILQKTKTNCQPISTYIDFWYGKGGMTPEVNFEKSGIKVLTGKEISKYSFNKIEPQWFIEKEKLNEKDVLRAKSEKVVVQDIVAHITKPSPHIKLTASLDQSEQFCLNTVMCFSDNGKGVSNRFALALINSRFISFYYYYFVFNQAIRTMHFMPGYADLIPIPNNYIEHLHPLEVKADIMLSKNKELQQLKQNLLQLLQSKYESIKLSNKLYDWPTLSFADFLKELSKQKIKLSLADQSEWMQYFEQEKTKANTLQQTITQTDKEIDAMVYALYGLTDEEIKIVEGN